MKSVNSSSSNNNNYHHNHNSNIEDTNNLLLPFLNLFRSKSLMVDSSLLLDTTTKSSNNNINSLYGCDAPGELESIKSSETEMSDCDYDDASLLQQHDSTKVLSSVTRSTTTRDVLLPILESNQNHLSQFHQSDSFPQSLSDRIIKNGSKSKSNSNNNNSSSSNNNHSLNRSNSAPLMRSPRRIIFPSIHDYHPQQQFNNHQHDSAQQQQDHHSTSNLHRSPQGLSSLDSNVLHNFHDSLTLNQMNYIPSKKTLDLPISSPRYATNTEKNKSLQTYNNTNISDSPKKGPTSIHTKEFEISPSSITSLPTSPSSLDHSSTNHTISNKLPKPGPSILRRSRSDISQNQPPSMIPSDFIEPPPLFPISSSNADSSPGSRKEPFQLKSRIARHSSPQPSESNNQEFSSSETASRRKVSMDEKSCTRIKFDPRVWVIEFKRSIHEDIWFSNEEMNQFKLQAIKRIQQREMKMIHSGTGRIVGVRPSSSASKIVFSNQALSAEDEECEDDSTQSVPRSFHSVVTSEIRSVLIIDPHDLILILLAKGIKSMLPHVSITVAHNSGEALERIFDARQNFPLSEGGCTHGFDLIIIEERLAPKRSIHSRHNDKTCTQPSQSPFPESGSGLIRSIRNEEVNMLQSWNKCNSWKSDHPRFAMIIGISAHIEQDQDKMNYAGANLMWGKPPPPMDHNLRAKILRILLKKRGRNNFYIKN